MRTLLDHEANEGLQCAMLERIDFFSVAARGGAKLRVGLRWGQEQAHEVFGGFAP